MHDGKMMQLFRSNDELLQHFHEEDLDHRVRYRPVTWDRWLPKGTLPARLLTAESKGVEGTETISRQDLVDLAGAVLSDGASPIELFVACQIWGSGTTNGRGPRYTAAALQDEPRARATFLEVIELLRSSQAGLAYRKRLPGWGPPFSTKFMYAVARSLDEEVHPRALILDARVWASLRGRWSSIEEAGGSRFWAKRYEAYVRAMHRWADAFDVRADAVERLLFTLNGEEHVDPAPFRAAHP